MDTFFFFQKHLQERQPAKGSFVVKETLCLFLGDRAEKGKVLTFCVSHCGPSTEGRVSEEDSLGVNLQNNFLEKRFRWRGDSLTSLTVLSLPH